ncbi:MAG: ATP-binding protein [Ardenticatenaceae bacterium]|nr:ATP-binding protein [Ardenticatenaceae bacterium]
MIDTKGNFYLGRIASAQTGETSTDPLLYDPADLTTHAVVVGMTGSGKTGLCLDLLEEAALNNIPALMIDPKGDITNALLHFPDLLPSDFQPWINVDQARRDGKTVEEAAEETAVLWRSGLAQWEIQPERLQALKDNVRFAVYTPGSDAGLPVSILASLKAPAIPWEQNKELLREQISGTVTALLGLIGLKDIDPVRSREHILLANIFEAAWSQGQDLDLGELIMQTQSPPFEKLGVFDINRFFPEKERFDLAMLLNNILAAPAFQAWIEGEPLDVARFLYDEDGRPRHTIFYIAHLPEAERMFFVTLLYSAVESWMRAQSGTTSLRALVYFDEIFGYLPPTANPPSKEPMLRMLKQARAFGVGLVLATQNPVDVDYKALSNAGTWFIGKLGTEQDKERLLDGLASATPGGLDRKTYDNLISAIGKRIFLLRNVHDKQPTLFQTRWAMNYLAGPVTRAQIPALNKLAGAGEQSTDDSEQLTENEAMVTDTASSPAQSPVSNLQSPVSSLPGTTTRPAVPGRVAEYFLPNNLTWSRAAAKDGRSLPASAQAVGLLYRPVLLAQASVRFLNRKYNLDVEVKRTAVVPEPDERGVVHWENSATAALDAREFDPEPLPQARFTNLRGALNDARTLSALDKDFADWVYRNTEVTVRANETLKVYAGPDVSEEQFARLCQEAASAAQDSELDKVEAAFEKKIDAIEVKLTREERELREDEAELSQRKQEELATHAETFLSLFSRRKRSVSSSLSKRRMTSKAEEDVKESKEAIAEFQAHIEELTKEMSAALDEVKAKWDEIAADTSEITVTPYKKDVNLELFGVAWLPHHLMQTLDGVVELTGFSLDRE